MRQYNFIDRLIIKLETFNQNEAFQKNKDQPKKDDAFSASLMRVNHTGEVCAQALYLGQALVTKDPELEQKLNQAAAEEHQHLQWCKERITELKDQTSILNPFFAVTSFGIGAAAGLMGDKISLGFLAETEHQVVKHLDKHLALLPSEDTKSREILLQMREDELRHATHAIQDGGVTLPFIVRKVMGLMSKVMTGLTRYI